MRRTRREKKNNEESQSGVFNREGIEMSATVENPTRRDVQKRKIDARGKSNQTLDIKHTRKSQ